MMEHLPAQIWLPSDYVASLNRIRFQRSSHTQAYRRWLVQQGQPKDAELLTLSGGHKARLCFPCTSQIPQYNPTMSVGLSHKDSGPAGLVILAGELGHPLPRGAHVEFCTALHTD